MKIDYSGFIGTKKDRLLILEVRFGLIHGDRRHYFFCKCDCGNEKGITTTHFRSRKNISCGCLKDELTSKRNFIDGRKKTPLYHTYKGMISRCTNPSNSHFKDYGGRGINVCQRWLDDYNNFVEDMGEKPDPSLSLDRINNNGNYEPDNCRWATQSEQMNNQRRSKKYKQAA